MGSFVAVTEEELARARRDPEFKYKLLLASLDRLLTELHLLQRANGDRDPLRARHMREGVRLAVTLAERICELRRVANRRPRLVFSPGLLITRASARFRPGAERTAARSHLSKLAR